MKSLNDFDIKVFIRQEEIEKRINELAIDIMKFFHNRDFIIIGVLKGSLFFMADLIRQFNKSVLFDFIHAKSYEGTQTSGVINILKEPACNLEGMDILVVEDILDTGITATGIKEYLINKGAKNVFFCTLLDKPSRRIKHIKADFCGFQIGDKFVVGYGLDYDEKFREKKDIYTLHLKG